MKKICLIMVLVFVSFFALGQSDEYYEAAQGLTGEELRLALHNIIKDHTTVSSYGALWSAFWSTDNKGDGVVWDMYTDIPDDDPEYEITYMLGMNQCGNYQSEGDCYNREHSWADSWFHSDDTARIDLHHIFPTDGWINNRRSNHPYGEVGTVSESFSNGSKLGTCRTPGFSGIVFEPIDEYKGDFARALMYVSVRYYKEDTSWGSSDMTNKSDILPWAMAMLLRWHEADPVGQKEIDRNNCIYEDYQRNRNPFIDHPDFAFRIWDPNWSDFSVGDVTDFQNFIFPNPVDRGGEVHFLRMDRKIDKMSVCDLSGRVLLQMRVTNETDFSLLIPEDLRPGFYVLQLQNAGHVLANLKLLVK